jgi:hypothetical protein
MQVYITINEHTKINISKVKSFNNLRKLLSRTSISMATPPSVSSSAPSVPASPKVLTPEVTLENYSEYLVRLNGKELVFTTNETEAVAIVDSVANFECAKLRNDSTEVFRQDLENGKRVKISSKTLGRMWNGSVQDISTIDFVSVPKASHIKQRIPVQIPVQVQTTEITVSTSIGVIPETQSDIYEEDVSEEEGAQVSQSSQTEEKTN